MSLDLRFTKVGNFIGLLTSGDRKNLLEFLKSSYFKVTEDERKLYRIILKAIDKGVVCDQESTAQALFPKLDSREGQSIRLKKLRSKLLNHLLVFLEVEGMLGSAQRPFWVLSELNRIGGLKFFDHYYRKAIREYGKQDENSETDLHLFRVEMERAEMLSVSERDIGEVLEKAACHLENYYDIERLRLAIARFNLRNTVKEEGDMELRVELREAVGSFWEGQGVLQQIYCLLGEILLSPSLEGAFLHYQAAFALFQHQKSKIAGTELKEIVYMLLNYCTQCLNANQFDKVGDYLRLNRDLIDAGNFEDSEIQNPAYLKNIVEVIQKNGGSEAVSKALEEFDIQDSMVLSIVDFHAGNFSGCLQKTNTLHTPYRDIFCNLTIRAYRLMSMFELGLLELLLDNLHALNMYLFRHGEIPQVYQLNYERFQKSMRKLLQATLESPETDKAKLLQLKEEVRAGSHFSWERWITEKIHSYLS